MYSWWSMSSSRIQLCWPNVSATKQPSSTSSGSVKCACSCSQSASSARSGFQQIASVYRSATRSRSVKSGDVS
jgi:hypothetical protein